MAIRKSLGSNRRRLVRQLLTESAAVGLLGGAAGVLLAGWAVEALLRTAAGELPNAAEAGLDGSVLLFALAVSLGTSLLFGLAPALRTAGGAADVRPARRHGGARGRPPQPPGTGAGDRRGGAVAGPPRRRCTAAAQLPGGARHRPRLPARPPGGAVAVVARRPATRTPPPRPSSSPASRNASASSRASRRAPRSATCRSAARRPTAASAIEGHEWPQDESPLADKRLAGPGYFATMGIPVRRGRGFDDRDRAGAAPVAVIDEALARQLLRRRGPDRSAHRLRVEHRRLPGDRRRRRQRAAPGARPAGVADDLRTLRPEPGDRRRRPAATW